MVGFDQSVELAHRVVAALGSSGKRLAVVESCTGGMLGAAVTSVAGSSGVFVGGWITYTNDMKRSAVGVDASLFGPGSPGAVSQACVEQMALGGLDRSGAECCLAITGIAGPAGGTPDKPVGTVWIALASGEQAVQSRRFLFEGDRVQVRGQSVQMALTMLERFLLAGG